MLVLYCLFVTLHHSWLFYFQRLKHTAWRKKAVGVIWCFGDFVAVRGVKEEGSGGGRDLEEIITPVSNQEEVIWPVRLPQWILAPQWNDNTPTSGSQWRVKWSWDIQSEYCDNYRPLQQIYTYATRSNYVVCSVHAQSHSKASHRQQYALPQRGSVQSNYTKMFLFDSLVLFSFVFVVQVLMFDTAEVQRIL